MELRLVEGGKYTEFKFTKKELEQEKKETVVFDILTPYKVTDRFIYYRVKGDYLNKREKRKEDEMDKYVREQHTLEYYKKEMVGHQYRHYKGDTFLVTDVAIDPKTLRWMVVYQNDDRPEFVWTMPYEDFTAQVDRGKYPAVKQIRKFEQIR